MRKLIIILGTILLLQFFIQPSYAVEDISATGITARGSIGRVAEPSVALFTIMANIEQRIYVENVEQHGFLGTVLAPASALTTIMANIEQRIYVENVEQHGFLGTVLAPESALTTIMANIEQRIYVENVEQHNSIGVVARPPSDLVDMLRMDVPLQPAGDSVLSPTMSPTHTPLPFQPTQTTIDEAPTPVVITIPIVRDPSSTLVPTLTTTPIP